jgi:hypothetical protein
MEININIIIDTEEIKAILSGLAQKFMIYRSIYNYKSDNYAEKIKNKTQKTIKTILQQLILQGIDIMDIYSPFNTYAKLIEFKPDCNDKDQLAK